MAILSLLPPDRARGMLGRKINAAHIGLLWDDEVVGDDLGWGPPPEWMSAWQSLGEALGAYMKGQQFMEIARMLEGENVEAHAERTVGGKPLPRAIAFGNVTAERLSRLAGLLLACEELDPHLVPAESAGDAISDQWLTLAQLPLAVRCGCGDPSSLSWFRFATRLRRPAHVLARAFPLPRASYADTAAREWVGARLSAWLNGELIPDVSDAERPVAEATELLLNRDVELVE